MPEQQMLNNSKQIFIFEIRPFFRYKMTIFPVSIVCDSQCVSEPNSIKIVSLSARTTLLRQF